MCVIADKKGNVVALDKVDDYYSGTTFPGGHIEPGETFCNSIIREVKEETGLDIEEPEIRGVYQWQENSVRNILFIYYTEKFSGQLTSSIEGQVYWTPFEELKKKELARGTEYVMQKVQTPNLKECYIRRTEEGYTADFF